MYIWRNVGGREEGTWWWKIKKSEQDKKKQGGQVEEGEVLEKPDCGWK